MEAHKKKCKTKSTISAVGHPTRWVHWNFHWPVLDKVQSPPPGYCRSLRRGQYRPSPNFHQIKCRKMTNNIHYKSLTSSQEVNPPGGGLPIVPPGSHISEFSARRKLVNFRTKLGRKLAPHFSKPHFSRPHLPQFGRISA